MAKIKHISISALTTIILLAAVFYSCKKEPGEGGKASIKGKLYIKDYNTAGNVLNSEYYGAGEMVFICYGNAELASNNIRTSYDGSFDFQYLRQGHYKVFALSRDTSDHINSGVNKVNPIITEIDITSNKQVVDIGNITVNK